MQKMKPQDFTRLTRDKWLYKELLGGVVSAPCADIKTNKKL